MPIATKTMAAIEAAIEADQGAAFRTHLRRLMPLAEDAYRGEDDPFRSHLGASILGRECMREIWNSWHWVTKPHFEGRILRLFNRGHLEEPRMVACLLTIGVEVWQFDENGKQFRISDHNGHFGGSMDAVCRGVPDMPDEPVLGEFKTHNEKSFAKMAGKAENDSNGRRIRVGGEGVIKAKWEHFIQMQIYMGKNGLRWALYMAVNKDTDEIHAEMVAFDVNQYNKALERAGTIIKSLSPPKRINDSPGWFGCRFCDHKPVCHGQALPEVNCRTCMHSKPNEEGTWDCGIDGRTLDTKAQLFGCQEFYKVNPAIKARP